MELDEYTQMSTKEVGTISSLGQMVEKIKGVCIVISNKSYKGMNKDGRQCLKKIKNREMS